MGQHVFPHLPIAFSIKDNPPYIIVFVERDSKNYPQKITPKKLPPKNTCSNTWSEMEMKGLVGDDDLAQGQQLAHWQHNYQ